MCIKTFAQLHQSLRETVRSNKTVSDLGISRKVRNDAFVERVLYLVDQSPAISTKKTIKRQLLLVFRFKEADGMELFGNACCSCVLYFT